MKIWKVILGVVLIPVLLTLTSRIGGLPNDPANPSNNCSFSSVDNATMLTIGICFVLIPHKFYGNKVAESERQKGIKTSKICGVVMISCSLLQLILQLF